MFSGFSTFAFGFSGASGFALSVCPPPITINAPSSFQIGNLYTLTSFISVHNMVFIISNINILYSFCTLSSNYSFVGNWGVHNSLYIKFIF